MTPDETLGRPTPSAVLDPDRLYRLLPAYLRQRDAAASNALRGLLRVIAGQVNLVELDIAQLYDDWFIDTCQDWVVPYLADLIGYKPLRPVPATTGRDAVEAALQRRTLIPRRDVANALRHRRRKGTAQVLEEIAWDVTGWPARVEDRAGHLTTTVSLSDPATRAGGTATLRTGGAPAPDVNQPATVDVRTGGGPNDVRLSVWRLGSYPVTGGVARSMDHAGPHCYSFHPLGLRFPLYARRDPALEQDDDLGPPPRAELWQMPGPITRKFLCDPKPVIDGAGRPPTARTELCGPGKSIEVRCGFWDGLPPGPPAHGEVDRPIPAAQVLPADLDDWSFVPPAGFVAVDPESGRLAFPPGQLPTDVTVSYHYGLGGPVGGGEYAREPAPAALAVYRVGRSADAEFGTVTDALAKWNEDVDRSPPDKTVPTDALIEIVDSGTYEEELDVTLGPGWHLRVAAGIGCRPVIRVPDHIDRPSRCGIDGPYGRGVCVLDGITIAGRGLTVSGPLARVELRHCTLVPGWDVDHHGGATAADRPSLVVDDQVRQLRLDRCVLGPVHVRTGADKVDPVHIDVDECIVDAMPDLQPDPAAAAFAAAAAADYRGHARLRLARCTVIGTTSVYAIDEAVDCIFTGPVETTRVDVGALDHCCLPRSVRTPPQTPPGFATSTPTPAFEDTRYGQPGYCVLAQDGPAGVAFGASDSSELGVFHDGFASVRLENLRVRLSEFTPATSHARVVVVT